MEKIDLLITGYNGDQASQIGKFNRNICGYYLNQSTTANTKPTVPTTLAHEITKSGDETLVTFTWGAATDAQTPQKALTYNMALKNTSTGKWFYNPMAVTSGETNGWRMVSEHGNVFGNKRWEIYNLPAGNYEWTVQAIDANFMGGTFAETKTFTITSTGLINPVSGVSISAFNQKINVKNSTSDMLNVCVYDLAGAMIKQINSASDININLNKGIYLVQVTKGIEKTVQKVVL